MCESVEESFVFRFGTIRLVLFRIVAWTSNRTFDNLVILKESNTSRKVRKYLHTEKATMPTKA